MAEGDTGAQPPVLPQPVVHDQILQINGQSLLPHVSVSKARALLRAAEHSGSVAIVVARRPPHPPLERLTRMEATLKAPMQRTITTLRLPKIGGSVGMYVGFDSNAGCAVVQGLLRGGAADVDGRVAVGDGILAVDGITTAGMQPGHISQMLKQAGPTVDITLAIPKKCDAQPLP